MLNCHYRSLVLLILIAGINTIQAEEPSEDSYYKGESYIKFGTQSYFQGEPISGIKATTLSGFLFSLFLTEKENSAISFSYSARLLFGEPSYLLGYRYRFLPKEKLTPVVEAGIGFTDPMSTFDKGRKLAQSIAVGFSYKFYRRWAFHLESRGVLWRQDYVTVISNELTIGIGYLR